MSRLVAIVLTLGCPATLLAQDAWIEQFDGKSLQGWEIDGDGKVDNGLLKLGGSGGALLRLKVPLGDKFSLRLEYQYAGPTMPALNWQTNAPYPSTWQFHGFSGQWIDATMNVRQGSWLNSNSGSYSFRTIDNNSGGSQGSGGLMAGTGAARDLVIVVHPNTTLTIRRISLQTTPPPPAVGTPWIAIVVLVGLLVSVMALGWFVNRRRPKVSSSRSA